MSNIFVLDEMEEIDNDWWERARKILLNDKSDDFLNIDHAVSLDAIVGIINQEIQWCYQNPMPNKVSTEFRDGFIKGLKQSKYLIVKFASNDTGVVDDYGPGNNYVPVNDPAIEDFIKRLSQTR